MATTVPLMRMPDELGIDTRLFTKHRDFDQLFTGFQTLHAISYVTSPTVLLDCIRHQGLEKITLVVGEGLSEADLRQSLRGNPINVLDDLVRAIEAGILVLYVPQSRSIHTKLFMLTKAGMVRLIQTSANLTETARNARQVNYAWYVDLEPDHPFVQQVRQDFDDHCSRCHLFMGDLLELLQNRQDLPRQELITAWLKGRTEEPSGKTFIATLQSLTTQALQHDVNVIAMDLPDSASARKNLEKILQPIYPTRGSGFLEVDSSQYLHYVHKTYGFPLLHLDWQRQDLRLYLDGKVMSMAEPWPEEAQTVNEALAHLEAYINMADYGQSQDYEFVKASLFEALLYMFFSPFACEYMKKKHEAYGRIDPKGPRFLYIYGNTHNGKTTFFRFALKLMTGHHVDALPRTAFSSKKIQAASEIGTLFPLVFDDIGFSGKKWVQDVLKSYWEVWWDNDRIMPQLVFSSNEPKLQDWGKSRIKRIDFDVAFVSNEEAKRRLKALLEHENHLFKWFAHRYIQRLEHESFHEDELHLARSVMQELYAYAKRPIPSFFLNEPVEKHFDLWQKRWTDIVYRRKEAKIIRENDRILIKFPSQMQGWEVQRMEAHLPKEIKSRHEGNTVIIETPEVFDHWCPKPKRWRSLSWLRIPRIGAKNSKKGR